MISKTAATRPARQIMDGAFTWTRNPGYMGFEGGLQLARGEGYPADSKPTNEAAQKYYIPFPWKDDLRNDVEKNDGGRHEDATRLAEKDRLAAVLTSGFVNDNWDAGVRFKQKEKTLARRASQER